ncbi:hypothetical protein BDQ17DRAFT_1536509 [Cyathus striatus]|nr:hypothetical protein BDQ17DRAFT_1536509 [Cyathus striatus]
MQCTPQFVIVHRKSLQHGALADPLPPCYPLGPDQTCAQCGAGDIQVIPLQKELDPPMATWFRSIPLALDEVAFAAKMQQESMAAQLRKLKQRDQQLRSAVERLKHDVFELKKMNDELVHENNELRRRLNINQHYHGANEGVSSDAMNSNGKRQMVIPPYNAENRSVSPRRAVAPMEQHRLTLLPNQQAPEFSTTNQHGESAGNSRSPYGQNSTRQPQQQRPPSGYFVQQYAYKPPETPQQQPPSVSYQSGPSLQPQPMSQQVTQSLQPPYQTTGRPPLTHSSSKFKPALPNSTQQPWSDAAPQRFVPPTTPIASSGTQARAAMAEPRVPSRMSMPRGGSQRVPFSPSGDKNGTFG